MFGIGLALILSSTLESRAELGSSHVIDLGPYLKKDACVVSEGQRSW